MYVDAKSIYGLPESLGKAAGLQFPQQPTLIEFIRYHTSAFYREPVLFSLPDTNIPGQVNYVFEVRLKW